MYASLSRLKLRNALYAGLSLGTILILFSIAYNSSTSFRFTDVGANISPSEWSQRAELVKQAFAHAYHGYEKYAMPHDELRPLTGQGMNGYNGWGATAYDSLDTMLLMGGFEDEYKRAVELVKSTNFSILIPPPQGTPGFIPYFETVIRYVGGLLSAYALTNDTILLRRAEELADTLDPVFDSPSGIAEFAVNPITGSHSNKKIAFLAEFASFQVEYTYLAKVSGKKKYYDRVKALNEIFKRTRLTDTGGMLPNNWDMMTGVPNPTLNKVSVGAGADSAHEYLLKQYLLTGKTDKLNLELYLRATTYILTNLLYLTPNRGLLYVTDTTVSADGDPAGFPSHKFEHLSCFLPGLLALGAHTLPLNDLASVGIDFASLGDGPLYNGTSKFYQALKGYDLKQLHLSAAQGLAQTCWLTYADQPSGLGPDEVLMLPAAGPKKWNTHTRQWDQTSVYIPWMDVMRKWKKGGARNIVPGVSEKWPVIWMEEDRGKGIPNRRDYHVGKAGYLLRPETVESLYILWRTTGDIKWRSRGWSIFEALERETKTESGYVTLKNVGTHPPTRGNSMPSFFLAETLKYLYLLFREDDPLPLDRWVFNTEAHPVPGFAWTADEVRFFNISG